MRKCHLTLYAVRHVACIYRELYPAAEDRPLHRNVSSSTILLHFCYNIATLLLNIATLLLKYCYTYVTILLQFCYNIATLMLQYCYTSVTILLHLCYNIATILLQYCYTCTSIKRGLSLSTFFLCIQHLPDDGRSGQPKHFVLCNTTVADRGSTVAKVLRYKSEGRWFDPRWCHWNFPLI